MLGYRFLGSVEFRQDVFPCAILDVKLKVEEIAQSLSGRRRLIVGAGLLFDLFDCVLQFAALDLAVKHSEIGLFCRTKLQSTHSLKLTC